MKGYLSVISSIQSHSVLPEVFEERRENLCFNVVGLHTVSPTALLHHLPGDSTAGLLFICHEDLVQLSNMHTMLANMHLQTATTNYLQYNFLHFFIWRLEFSNKDQHHFSSIVVGIFCIHKRNKIPNSL